MSLRRALPLALLAACDREEGALQRAIEASLADCTYSSELYNDRAERVEIGHGEYDMNGDLVLEEGYDPYTDEVQWRWEASYGAPHEVAVSRASNPWMADGPAWVETSDWIDGSLVLRVIDENGDGFAEEAVRFDYDGGGDLHREEHDWFADGDSDATFRWAWADVGEGRSFEKKRAEAGVDTMESWGRVDRQGRLLYSNEWDDARETIIRGYGELSWATDEVRTDMILPGNGSIRQLRRTLDADGRLLDETMQTDWWRDGMIFSSHTQWQTREWACP